MSQTSNVKPILSSAPGSQGTKAVELAVLGGGIIGLSIAYECCRRGMKVTLLEKGKCGGQATGAAAGMLAPYSEIGEDPDPFFDLCQLSLKLYPRWQEEIRTVSGLDFEYTQSGSLHLALHEADELALETRLQWQREWGVRGEIVRGKVLRELEPHLTERALAALYYPDEAHVYAPDYVVALMEACRRAGVRIIEEAGDVQFKEIRTDGVLLSTEKEGLFSAERCVVATGSWTGLFEKALGVRLPIFPIRGQICAYHKKEEEIRHIIFSSQGYLLTKRNGTIVCGASEDIAGFDTSTTEQGISRLVRISRQLFPFLNEREPFHRWAGLRPATQDGYPLLGALDHLPHIILASGHYRNGILLGPATAQVIGDLMEGKEPPVNLRFFDPLRFS